MLSEEDHGYWTDTQLVSGAGEMAWALRACTALAKDLSSIPITRVGQLTRDSSSSQGTYTDTYIPTHRFTYLRN